MNNDRIITAKVYNRNSSGVYYLKVEMFGMYISDITARESIKKPQEGLWIQMPAFRRDDGTYKKIIEFPNNNDIFKHIEKICRKAVEDYIDSTQQLSVDDFIIDELAPQDEYEKGLDDVSKK